MHLKPWIVLPVVAAAALPWIACAGSGSAPLGTGTGGTTGTTTTTGDPCTLILAPGPCDDCIAQSCCAKLDACNVDVSCLDCFTGNTSDPAVCGVEPTKTTLADLQGCLTAACSAACAPTPPACNPVSHSGCPAGSACDTVFDKNQNQTFLCFAPPPPNTEAVCGACDDKTTACADGSTCMGGKCAKFCCDDGDCGSGVCESLGAFGVGLCVTSASVEAGVPAPACDAPATSPSMGSCVTGLDGGSAPSAGGTPAPPADAGDGG